MSVHEEVLQAVCFVLFFLHLHSIPLHGRTINYLTLPSLWAFLPVYCNYKHGCKNSPCNYTISHLAKQQLSSWDADITWGFWSLTCSGPFFNA